MLAVTRTHVSRMERGEKIPSVPLLLKISDIFGVTADPLSRDELELAQRLPRSKGGGQAMRGSPLFCWNI
jgi:transcriptional regulator with XRE-family HTH domain